MRDIFRFTVTAVALSAMAFAASADEAKGMVEKLDAATSTFWIGDKQFIMSDDATGNVTLEELRVGDTVTVEFAQSQGSEPHNVMRIEKDGDGMPGDPTTPPPPRE